MVGGKGRKMKGGRRNGAGEEHSLKLGFIELRRVAREAQYLAQL